MQLSNVSKWALGIAAVLAVVACNATVSLEAGGESLGSKGHVRFGFDGRDVKAEKIPDNKRADVKFYDAQGNEIPNSGATGVGEGDKVPVPAGATHATISGPSAATSCTGCTPPPPPPSGGSGAGGGMVELPEEFADAFALDSGPSFQRQSTGGLAQRTAVTPTEKWAYVCTLGGDFDGSTAWSNVSAFFSIAGNYNAAQIQARISPVLFNGPGSAMPSGVTVEQYVRMDAETLGARLFVADQTQAITSFSMVWNSVGKTPTMYDAPNGWKVAEVFLPLSDINIALSGGGAMNNLDLVWMTFEDTTQNELHDGRFYALQ